MERQQMSLCQVVFPGRETIRGSHIILCESLECKSCAMLGALDGAFPMEERLCLPKLSQECN